MKIILAVLLLVWAMVLQISIYFVLSAIIFASSNTLLGTSFVVYQSALFSSLLIFVLKLIFYKRERE